MCFLDLIDQVLRVRDNCRILDLGGEAAYWHGMADLIGDRRLHITLLNLSHPDRLDDGFVYLAGDARRIAEANLSYDLVHSNSVIEHVGSWDDMRSMAAEVRRLASGYFVQTPYFWFPIEPHCTTAFFHWLPQSVRVSMLMRKARGNWSMAPDVSTAMSQVQSATLLDRRMMSALFPDALILNERFAGLVKSLIATRPWQPH